MVITLVHHLSFTNGPAYVSDTHGCVYGLIDNALCYTPQLTDGTFSTDEDDWVEVDHLAMLGEDEDILLHVEWVEDMLQREYQGIFADPRRMEDTPLAEMYGG